MALPRSVRRLAPARLRDDVRLRALAVGSGLVPPRTMHSAEEAELLASLAAGARRIVEIGVYEGSSAVVLARAMPAGAELHLIDPFGHHPSALPAGWGATEWASRRVVARAARSGRDGGAEGGASRGASGDASGGAARGASGGRPRVVWHTELSVEVAARWTDPVDLVFVDGDHSEEACELDWSQWSRFVVPGGHVALHDARADQPGGRGLPGPTAVVNRHFRAPERDPAWSIVAEVDRTVVVRRSAEAPPPPGA